MKKIEISFYKFKKPEPLTHPKKYKSQYARGVILQSP